MRTCLHKLPHGLQEGGVCAIANDHRSDDLIGEDRKGNLRGRLWRQTHLGTLVLALQNSKDRRLKQLVLIAKAPVNRPWSESRVARDAGDRRSLDSMLSQNLGGSLQQFPF